MTEPLLTTRRYKVLAQDWTPELLSRECYLTSNDLAEIRTCRGAPNRLGFAVQLVLLRLLNCTVPPLEQVPERLVQFISMQISVTPTVLADYGSKRPQTRDDHAAQIRTYLDLAAYTTEAHEAALQTYLFARALQRDTPSILLEEAEAWLHREGILYPAESTLTRLINHARAAAEEHLITTIVEQVTPHQAHALTELLTREEGKRGSTLAWLKAAPFVASPKSLKDLLKKWRTIEETRVQDLDLAALNRNRVRIFAQLGRQYHRDTLERFAPAKRNALLACFLQDRLLELTDEIVTSLNDLIFGIFRRARNKVNEQRVTQGKQTNRSVLTLRKVTKVVLDKDVPDDQVRATVFKQIPEAQVQAAYDQSGTTVRPEDDNVYDIIEKSYSFLREFFPDALNVLPLSGTQAAQPVLRAITFLRAFDASNRRKLTADTPLDFVSEDWKSVVVAADGSINRHMWEFCLAERVRNGLRSSDIYITGSRQHRVWTTYLHTPQAWAERRESWFAEWHAARDVDTYLDALEARYIATVEQVLAGWEDNDFARIVEVNGETKLAYSPDDKLPTPPTVAPLKEAVLAVLPHGRIGDLMVEVEAWVGILSCFTHLNERGTGDRARDPDLDRALCAVILAQGCNLPLTVMADAAEIPYHRLTYVSDWYIREETLRQAIIKLIDYHHALPLTALFGPGTASMSDGIRFGVAGRALHAQHAARHFGPKKGISIVDMTSDQYSHPYLQVVQVHLREAHAALDGLLHHETELPLHEHMTDTHGYTELIYALFELESFIFSPRIRDLDDQRLYPLAREVDYGVLKPLFRGQPIDRARVTTSWDDAHRIAASLKDGTVTATLLSTKLQALDQKNTMHKALEELGRMLKTINILTYISDEPYRRRIQRMLNKGELVHFLAREIFHGQQGVFRERDLTDQINRATCLSLLINVVTVWNTRYLQAALEYLRGQNVLVQDSDVGHLSPVMFEHLNFHGSHQFDFAAQRKRGGKLRPLRLPS